MQKLTQHPSTAPSRPGHFLTRPPLQRTVEGLLCAGDHCQATEAVTLTTSEHHVETNRLRFT